MQGGTYANHFIESSCASVTRKLLKDTCKNNSRREGKLSQHSTERLWSEIILEADKACTEITVS
jgi:hypothetical protein